MVSKNLSVTNFDPNYLRTGKTEWAKKLIFNLTRTKIEQQLLVCYSVHGLNNEPSDDLTILYHSNMELVGYLDPHCTGFYLNSNQRKINNQVAYLSARAVFATSILKCLPFFG